MVDDFTPEDKYFYLYLFTNPQTNLCGCYEVSLQTMANQTGYNKETIERLLDRFEKVHDVIRYSKKTKEILILNWHKYNWQGGNQLKCLSKEIEGVKNLEFKAELVNLFNEKFENENPLISPLQANCLQATVTVPVTVTDNVADSIKEIIDYLNIKTNSNYKYKSKNTVSLIKARLNDGFSVDDFKTVIDKKTDEWINDSKMVAYLRPSTLFSSGKFESYLNQKTVKKKPEEKVNPRKAQLEDLLRGAL